MTARVLVTDGDERSALAVVRSLGRAGHTVIVGARGPVSLAGDSRYAAARLTLPDALAAPDRFAEAVGEAARQHRCDVVMPVTDASVLAVLSRPDAVAPALVPLPPLERFQRVSDKAGVAEVAASLGIRIPRQVRIEQRDGLRSAASAGGVSPPLVLKPARSIAGEAGQRSKHGVVHADDWAAVERLGQTLPDSAFPLLMQERIVGPGIGVFLLMWQDRLVAAFAHRRLREKPPAGGVSVLSESVAMEPALLERSRALMEHFGWSGVAMVEYKRDAATGEAVLMEVNGRFWGSLQLAIDAGVDFPRLLVEVALGLPVAAVTDYRVGVRSRWTWGDMDHLIARLTHSAQTLSLPPGSPGRLRAVADFVWSSVAPGRGQVFQWTDPRPAWRESVNWLRAAALRAVTDRLTVAHVVAPAAVGGLERVVRALAAGFDARGHQVHVIHLFGEGEAVTPLQFAPGTGVTSHNVVSPPRHYWAERREVARLCRALGVQVVHTHGYHPDVVASAAARDVGALRVSTAHGFTGGGFKNQVYEFLQVRSYRRFDAVVAVSRKLAENLAGRGVPAGRLHCIPNAWPGSPHPLLPRDEARAILGLPRDGRCLGWVGRLSREKGADVLLDAVARAGELGCTVAIVGEGRESAALRALASSLGLGDNVHWCGSVPEMARCYGAFDGFVLSSRTEGTPIALFEAMAAWVPLVVTRVGGVPDVVSEREALMVAPEDPAALAAAMRTLLADPAAAGERAGAAGARLAADFAAGPWLDRYEALYRTLKGNLA